MSLKGYFVATEQHTEGGQVWRINKPNPDFGATPQDVAERYAYEGYIGRLFQATNGTEAEVIVQNTFPKPEDVKTFEVL